MPSHGGSKLPSLHASQFEPGMHGALVHANGLHDTCNRLGAVVPPQTVGSQATLFDSGQPPFATQVPDILGPKPLTVRRALPCRIPHLGDLTVGLPRRMKLTDALLHPLTLALLTVTHRVSDDLMLAPRPGLPVDLQPDLSPQALLIDNDRLDHEPKQVFAVGMRGRLRVPDPRQVLANGENLLLLLGRDVGPILPGPRLVVPLGGLDSAKRRFPVALQRVSHETMLWFCGVLLALRPLGFIARPLPSQVPLLFQRVHLAFPLTQCLQGSGDTLGDKGLENERRNGVVHPRRSNLLALRATRVLGLKTAAIDRNITLRSGGAPLHPTPTPTADGDSLQQGFALARHARPPLTRPRAVGLQPSSMRQIRVPGTRGRRDILKTNRPRFQRPLHHAAAAPTGLLPRGVDDSLALRVSAGRSWVVEQASDRATARRLPDRVMGGGSAHGARWNPPLLARQRGSDRPRTAECSELGDNEPQARLNFLVGIEGHDAIALTLESHRQLACSLTALGFVTRPGLEPQAQMVKLGLAHHACKSQDQAVVIESGLIELCAVGDERADHRA